MSDDDGGSIAPSDSGDNLQRKRPFSLKHLFEDDDDEEVLIQQAQSLIFSSKAPARKHGGSVPGRRPNKERSTQQGHINIMNDYFVEKSTYDNEDFRRRFRVRKARFLKIVDDVTAYNPEFLLRVGAFGKVGLSPIQKITAALRQLAYREAADRTDKYVRIGESTAIAYLRKFVRAIVDIYESEFLRPPTEADTQHLLEMHAKHGFEGMLGSVDCMHWQWKNCPTAWAGGYTGKEGVPTLVLEAAVSQDLWFWHAFFGMPGSHNDINVLDRSHLFTDLLNGIAPPVEYALNGNTYNMGYFLADGIYPKMATLVQSISLPQGRQKKLFVKLQEAARKDVERAFGVLQARWKILTTPARFWKHDDLLVIMLACIIMHNMNVQDNREDPQNDEFTLTEQDVVRLNRGPCGLQQFADMIRDVNDEDQHYLLRSGLMQHLWDWSGQQDSEDEDMSQA